VRQTLNLVVEPLGGRFFFKSASFVFKLLQSLSIFTNFNTNMDAQNNLKLRRSDRSSLLIRKHEDDKLIKRDHLRDILI
jgi:hypothetical protein